MKRAVILEHAPFEGPARIAPLLEARGYTLETCALFRGAPVPADLSNDDVLIVMGGPMGVGDLDRAEFSFLRAELALLERRMLADAPVLGVCLGAQLMAAAAGARVQPMLGASGERVYEVGWAALRFEPGQAVLRGLPETAPVLHWHGDACELPAGARRLASTDACPNQAFQLGNRQFGLQFHCEVGQAEIAAFVESDAAFVIQANGPSGPARILADTQRYLPEFSLLGARLLSNILDAMLG